MQDDPPRDFLCCVNLTLLVDPVIAADCKVYERELLRKLVLDAVRNNRTPKSPLTNAPLVTTFVSTDFTLRGNMRSAGCGAQLRKNPPCVAEDLAVRKHEEEEEPAPVTLEQFLGSSRPHRPDFTVLDEFGYAREDSERLVLDGVRRAERQEHQEPARPSEAVVAHHTAFARTFHALGRAHPNKWAIHSERQRLRLHAEAIVRHRVSPLLVLPTPQPAYAQAVTLSVAWDGMWALVATTELDWRMVERDVFECQYGRDLAAHVNEVQVQSMLGDASLASAPRFVRVLTSRVDVPDIDNCEVRRCVRGVTFDTMLYLLRTKNLIRMPGQYDMRLDRVRRLLVSTT